MQDRRLLTAIALIMILAMAPLFFRKPPVTDAGADSLLVRAKGPAPLGAAPAMGAADSAAVTATPMDSTLPPALPEDTVVVRSGLYRYAISTRGGRIVSARFLRYRSMADEDLRGGQRDTLELLGPNNPLLAGRFVLGGDTLRLDRLTLQADADSLTAATAPATLTLRGDAGAHPVELRYTFTPDDYRVRVDGTIGALGGTGGTLLLGMGHGFRQTEAVVAENHREGGIVTQREGTELTRFSSMKPRLETTLAGPFEWVAVKSKYFVAGLFAVDSTAQAGAQGKIIGVRAIATDTNKVPHRAEVDLALAVGADGRFGWDLFLGPMEYDRLTAMGRDFDDVNPYGWPGFRTVIRPFAVAIRAVFVGMHQFLGFGYGWVIVIFGILVRLLLWPLNQKAMKSMVAMQAIQPQLQAVQARYKEDPKRLQEEMMKLYKDNNVNPFGGCWPMLLPYPLLVAVFFVLANTIELRGVGFLWMSDLARFDPLYIIPVVMSVSMFAVSKVSQMGMPPNPQAKTMMYVMPVMMFVFFFRFAAGLNLYYAVQNLASLPQQWLIMKERQKLATSPVVKTKGKPSR